MANDCLDKKCPHCGGKLVKAQDFQRHRKDYSCLKCGRGWKVQENDDWHSRGSAGFEVYSSDGEYVGSWD